MNAQTQTGEDTSKGILQYVSILLQWRRLIIVIVAAATIIAVVISFVLPKWYRATASIMPPKDLGLLNILGTSTNLLRGLGSLPRVSGLGQNNGPYNYFALLKSRRAMEAVVTKFNLVSVYGISDTMMEKAIKELRDNTAFEYQDDDYITVEVMDKEPRRAADMANYFVDLLNSMSVEMGTQEARNNREFIERRVALTSDSLRLAEESLKKFQEKHGMILTPEQNNALSAVAELYANRAKKQLEMAILEQRVTPENELLQQLRLELREYDKSLAGIPEAGMESFRLYRDVLTQQKILEFLLPMYEQAKINEQKDVPVLNVLDKAVPPELKAKPQRLLIVAITFFLSFFAMMAIVFFLHGVLSREGGSQVERTFRHVAERLAVRSNVVLQRSSGSIHHDRET